MTGCNVQHNGWCCGSCFFSIGLKLTNQDWQSLLLYRGDYLETELDNLPDNPSKSIKRLYDYVSYKKNDNDENGKVIITNGPEKKEVPLTPSISHNFTIGVDAQDDVLWVATSKGVCRGELIK